MRNLKPIAALVLTGIGSTLVATFQVASPQLTSATTTTAVATTATGAAASGSTASGTTTTGSATTGTSKTATATAASGATASPTSSSSATTSPTQSATASPAATSAATAGTAATSAATGGTAATPTPAPTTTVTTAQFADGTYNGAAIREPWGTFEVQATISGGKLVNVTLVSAPSDGHSSRINSAAVPLLTQSAIAAQSAQIDAVSGATWTSQSYMTSLQAALDAAHAAASTIQTAA